MTTMRSTATRATEARQCDQHGPYVATNLFGTIWSTCQACQGEAEGRARVARESAAKVERMEWRLDGCGIDGRFARATLENYVTSLPAQATALAAAREAVETFALGRWAPVGFLGKPGTGKTHLVSAIATTFIRKRDLGAEVHTARDIIRELRSTWGKSDANDAEQRILNRLCRVDLLVIDEIGVGTGSESELTQLFDVIDMRYRLERSVFFASNLTPRDLRASVGDRIYDRLIENATVVPCDWTSYRREIRS